MKTLSLSLLAAAFATGAAFAATAYTTPVGYYEFDGKAGGNLFVPSFVNSPAFAGAITGSSATTLTVAANSLTENAFNAAGGYATHYVEITAAGTNQGVVIDIASNTTSVITLASDITPLALAGTETIAVRPHVTLKSAFAAAEASLVGFADSATFYGSDGSITTYLYDGAGGWTSDFSTPDGNPRPIAPGTGVVLGLTADADLTVVGEVKSSPVVVQLTAGVVNIVGPVNPLVGDSSRIVDLGFADMAAFADSLTLYNPGTLTIGDTYLADGAGNVTKDFSTPSLDELSHTIGAVLTAAGNSSLRINSGL
jgi:hypothetical protein